MQQKYPLLIQLFARLKVKSPDLFAKLQVVFASIAGIFELCTLLKDLVGVHFPAIAEQYINHGSATVAGIMYLLTALPVDDKKELHEKIEEIQNKPVTDKPQ